MYQIGYSGRAVRLKLELEVPYTINLLFGDHCYV